MISKKGSHGTSKVRAQIILSDGFISGSGRGGTGIYFWEESDHYIELSKAWYCQSCERKYFKDEKNPECAVLIAELLTNDKEFLDLEDDSLKNAIFRLAKHFNIKDNDLSDLSALYDLFYENLENDLKINYKIISLRVAAPKTKFLKDYSIKILGVPRCLVVRDVNCIKKLYLYN